MDFDITKDRILLVIKDDLNKLQDINEVKLDLPRISGLKNIYKRAILVGSVANDDIMIGHAYRIKVALKSGADFKKANSICLYRKNNDLLWRPKEKLKELTGKEIKQYEEFFERYEELLKTNYLENGKMSDQRLKEIILHDEAQFQKGIIVERDKYGYIIERDDEGNTIKKDDDSNIIEIIPPDK